MSPVGYTTSKIQNTLYQSWKQRVQKHTLFFNIAYLHTYLCTRGTKHSKHPTLSLLLVCHHNWSWHATVQMWRWCEGGWWCLMIADILQFDYKREQDATGPTWSVFIPRTGMVRLCTKCTNSDLCQATSLCILFILARWGPPKYWRIALL